MCKIGSPRAGAMNRLPNGVRLCAEHQPQHVHLSKRFEILRHVMALRERCGWSFGYSRGRQHRFMESCNLQEWKRSGAMNHLAEVGRVTPSTLRSSAGLVSALCISATEDGCAPCLALQEKVVAAVGAQRAARPTFRFMDGRRRIDAGIHEEEHFAVLELTAVMEHAVANVRTTAILGK
jgi:hypothetical protein